MEKKYFSPSYYNKFTSSTLDAKIKQKKLKWNQSGFTEKIKRLTAKEEIKKFARAPELQAEQDRIVKLQRYYLSLFIG